MRVFFVFLVAGLIGLLIQATLIHASFPAAVAPDFIVILTVAVSLYYHTAWGALGAFCLGLFADFASADYLGPNAAGCVAAFCLVGLIANRVYADKGIAITIITFVCSIAKSATLLLLYYLYVDGFIVPDGIFGSASWEAFLSALLAPFVLRTLGRRAAPHTSSGKTQGAPIFRWSN
ncbi:MAG: rod shape-determining protein MreD [Bdellovibrionota bacterium]